MALPDIDTSSAGTVICILIATCYCHSVFVVIIVKGHCFISKHRFGKYVIMDTRKGKEHLIRVNECHWMPGARDFTASLVRKFGQSASQEYLAGCNFSPQAS